MPQWIKRRKSSGLSAKNRAKSAMGEVGDILYTQAGYGVNRSSYHAKRVIMVGKIQRRYGCKYPKYHKKADNSERKKPWDLCMMEKSATMNL